MRPNNHNEENQTSNNKKKSKLYYLVILFFISFGITLFFTIVIAILSYFKYGHVKSFVWYLSLASIPVLIIGIILGVIQEFVLGMASGLRK